MQICQGPSGSEYRSCLEALRLTSLDPIVHELATSNPPYIHAERTELNGQSCFMISNLNKARLGKYASNAFLN